MKTDYYRTLIARLLRSCFGLVILFHGGSTLADEVLKSTRDDLYRSAAGNIYFRSVIMKWGDYKHSSEEERKGSEFYVNGPGDKYLYWYRDFFGRKEIDEDTGKPAPKLRDTIDFKTWTQVSSEYYMDSKHVYYVWHESDGGFFCVVSGLSSEKLQFFHQGRWQKWEVAKDVPKMKDIQRHYVSDGKNIYYKASPMKDVDAATFRFMEVSTSEYCDIGIDKNGMIEDDSRWTEKNFKTLTSNILDEKGNILNTSEENLNWIRVYNSVATAEFRISMGGK